MTKLACEARKREDRRGLELRRDREVLVLLAAEPLGPSTLAERLDPTLDGGDRLPFLLQRGEATAVEAGEPTGLRESRESIARLLAGTGARVDAAVRHTRVRKERERECRADRTAAVARR